MAMAISFERVLQRALIRYSAGLEPGGVEYRYVHHEIIEESRHSQMFGEFLRRVGAGDGATDELSEWGVSVDLDHVVAQRPELLFLAALAGEQPIDALQRELVTVDGCHPTLVDVCRTHVKEEARHIGYARAFLRETVPRLDPKRRRRLSLLAPPLVMRAAWLMVVPNASALAGLAIDDPSSDPSLQAELLAYVHRLVRPTSELCRELGLIDGDLETLWSNWTPRRPRPQMEQDAASERALAT